MKNDFGGHSNEHHNNVYAYVGQGFGICTQIPGEEDFFYNNAVIQTKDGNYANGACSGAAKTIVYNNSVFSPKGNITECGYPLASWQKQGNDPGTTAAVTPPDAELLAWAAAALGL